MIKKIFSVVLVCILTLLESSAVFAQESVSALDFKDKILSEGDCVENDDGSFSFTLQLQSNARSSVKENIQMNYTIIPTTEEAKKTLKNAVDKMRLSGGTTTLTNSDTAGCVSAYSTISWDSYIKNNRNYLYLTGISGGYTAEGSGSYISSGVSVTGHSVTFGQSGFVEGGTVTQSKTENIGTSVRSYSYSIPSDWEAVAEDGKYVQMGAYYVITLERGSTSWNCEISNNY